MPKLTIDDRNRLEDILRQLGPGAQLPLVIARFGRSVTQRTLARIRKRIGTPKFRMGRPGLSIPQLRLLESILAEDLRRTPRETHRIYLERGGEPIDVCRVVPVSTRMRAADRKAKRSQAAIELDAEQAEFARQADAVGGPALAAAFGFGAQN